MTGTTVELPQVLAERLRACARDQGCTLEWVCLVAVQDTYDRLKTVFTDPPGLELFPGALPSRRSPRSSDATRRVTLRTRQANLDRLDELAAELGAPSRTALLVQALRLYLKETS